MVTGQTLAQLLPNQTIIASLADRVPTGMTLDSREIVAGDLFVALAGAKVNGVNFIDDALAAGAIAVLADSRERFDGGQPVVGVRHLDKQLSDIAGRFFADPSDALEIVGITGTNGKTTCALLTAQLFELLGQRAAAMGTLGYGLISGEFRSTGFTTPDAIAAQRALRELVDAGAETLSMEVSSHALAQHRVRNVCIGTAVFTNLSHDHLDFHGDLKAYGKAKAKLLKARGLSRVILNRDDDWCKSLRKKTQDMTTVLTYSLKSPKADLYCEEIEYSASGMRAHINHCGHRASIQSSLLGEFNASNLLAAMATALSHGYSVDQIAPLVSSLEPAQGRMEQITVTEAQDLQVVVDYAHTPDALLKALRALRRHTRGNIWCVFGCGGDRDSDKRALMGRAAEKSADHVIVTNDNPRGEDPARIAAQIVQGMREPERCLIIADRASAIELAVQQAASDDAVLIAGKGHEQVQIFADRQVPFSDIKCARRALEVRSQRQRQGGEASP